LSRAFARSPGARSFACALFACFWDSGLFFPLYWASACGAPWVALVGQDNHAGPGTYRQAVAVRIPTPATSWAKVSTLCRCAKTSMACRPGLSLRQAGPINAR